MIVREYASSDFDAVFRLNQILSLDQNVSFVREELNSSSTKTLVAEKDDEVIGFISLSFPHFNQCYNITEICVAEQERGNGIGSKLLKSIIETVKSNSGRFLTIQTEESNQAAIGLYEKVGFTISHKFNNYLGDHLHMIWMEMDLRTQ